MTALREQLGKYPRVTLGIAGGIIVVACVFIGTGLRNRHPMPAFPTKAFYTCDDGVTLFADDVNKIPPFDHDGQDAVAARVLTSDRGRTHWVQYLAKYDAVARERFNSPQATSATPAAGPAHLLVKKPGSGQWVPMMSHEGSQIIEVQPADGMESGPVEEVLP
jgi:hypothetical protein